MAEPEVIREEQTGIIAALQREAEILGWQTEVTGTSEGDAPNVLDLIGPSGQGYTLSIGPHL